MKLHHYSNKPNNNCSGNALLVQLHPNRAKFLEIISHPSMYTQQHLLFPHSLFVDSFEANLYLTNISIIQVSSRLIGSSTEVGRRLFTLSFNPSPYVFVYIHASVNVFTWTSFPSLSLSDFGLILNPAMEHHRTHARRYSQALKVGTILNHFNS